VPQMLLRQTLGEIKQLLDNDNLQADYERLYTKLNGLIWNATSRGLLAQTEQDELLNRLTDFESMLFRVE